MILIFLYNQKNKNLGKIRDDLKEHGIAMVLDGVLSR